MAINIIYGLSFITYNKSKTWVPMWGKEQNAFYDSLLIKKFLGYRFPVSEHYLSFIINTPVLKEELGKVRAPTEVSVLCLKKTPTQITAHFSLLWCRL